MQDVDNVRFEGGLDFGCRSHRWGWNRRTVSHSRGRNGARSHANETANGQKELTIYLCFLVHFFSVDGLALF